ncbi:MAG TPA: sulfate permease [Gaiellales bacterium]|nr:sulfate permease [Gaiellales bacterium]
MILVSLITKWRGSHVGSRSGDRSRLRQWFPGVGMLRSYERAWVRDDVVAGCVLVALLVPQGMAYAQLAGMPAVAGIYATMVPMAVYALIGPSRLLVMGPDSAVSPLVAAAVLAVAATGSAQALALGGVLAVGAGVVCVAAGVARAGFVTELFSRPVRIGYLNGLALTILVGQVPRLLGGSTDSHTLVGELRSVATAMGGIDWASFALGISALMLILGMRRWWPRFPGILVAVAVSTLAVSVFELSVPVVGQLPSGLPAPALPHPGTVGLTELAAASVAIAFIAFTDTSVLSRSYAGRIGENVDQNRELVALGTVNIAAGLFQGFPVSSSASRTAVAETAGARTQAAGLVATALMAFTLAAAGGITRNLPEAALAAVVVSAALALFDVHGMIRLARIRRSEFGLCVACFAGVAVFGVLIGIFAAIGLSLLDFFRRQWRPHDAVLGRVPGRKGYHDTARHPEARQIPGLLLYRFDSPLFFANSDHFRDHVHALVSQADAPVRWVVIAAEPITDIDTTAGDTIMALDKELDAVGIQLAFAELKGPVRDRLGDYGALHQLEPNRFFPTIGTAVRGYVAATGVEWVDWNHGTSDNALLDP